MVSYRTLLASLLFLVSSSCSEIGPPAPYGAVPSERQLEWHKLSYYAFIHFSPNTFTDKEWGYGDESPSIFNPKELDCRQWARVAKEAGMEGIVIDTQKFSRRMSLSEDESSLPPNIMMASVSGHLNLQNIQLKTLPGKMVKET